MARFIVTGPPYNGHPTGAIFEATRDEAIERALARGSIAPVKPAKRPDPKR